MNAWVGVDLDGTLAEYDCWRGVDHIGRPVERMRSRVLAWLAQGVEVRIFTARAFGDDPAAIQPVKVWCLQYLGVELPVTCTKDYGMIELWDDRAVAVVPNTGVGVRAVS